MQIVLEYSSEVVATPLTVNTWVENCISAVSIQMICIDAIFLKLINKCFMICIHSK